MIDIIMLIYCLNCGEKDSVDFKKLHSGINSFYCKKCKNSIRVISNGGKYKLVDASKYPIKKKSIFYKWSEKQKIIALVTTFITTLIALNGVYYKWVQIPLFESKLREATAENTEKRSVQINDFTSRSIDLNNEYQNEIYKLRTEINDKTTDLVNLRAQLKNMEIYNNDNLAINKLKEQVLQRENEIFLKEMQINILKKYISITYDFLQTTPLENKHNKSNNNFEEQLLSLNYKLSELIKTHNDLIIKYKFLKDSLSLSSSIINDLKRRLLANNTTSNSNIPSDVHLSENTSIENNDNVLLNMNIFNFNYSSKLRYSPKQLVDIEIEKMIKDKGFYHQIYNKFSTGYPNQFYLFKNFIFDSTSGLVWRNFNDINLYNFNDVVDWFRESNRRGDYGNNYWRLPTLEEALSIIEPKGVRSVLIDRFLDFRPRNKEDELFYFLFDYEKTDSGWFKELRSFWTSDFTIINNKKHYYVVEISYNKYKYYPFYVDSTDIIPLDSPGILAVGFGKLKKH